ncbi:MAG: MBL fold metallo-hydrolase [Myxococcales bacterium]|nr:MAG: MBL fold metallo-hydrolase [Myxococcales bacterium]
MSIRFLGGAGTVTGSKFLLAAGRETLLVDCGLFQGQKELRLLNWQPFPLRESEIDHVAITHGHIDHCGYLPRLVKNGYRGAIWATSATCDLMKILLPDSAHLQAEQAEDANRKGFSKHKPALPLYDLNDAKETLRHLRTVKYRQPQRLGKAFTATWHPAGHILGSSVLAVGVERPGDKPLKLLFSGDLGRYNAPILVDPEDELTRADYVLVESTYGDRLHEPFEQSVERFAGIVRGSAERGGVLLIPAFAIGRTQTLLYLLRELEEQKRIPSLPIYVDSPMAAAASEQYRRHSEDYDEETLEVKREGGTPMLPRNVRFCSTREESKALNKVHSRAIIISASGMMTGGRILHHAIHRLPKPENTILFCGFQAAGTRGRRILDGEDEVKIHGALVPIRAHREMLDGFSAHADASEIMRWLANLKTPPKQTFIVHGEPESSSALADRVSRELGFASRIPKMGEEIELS